jgi:hypothetical protein
MISHLQMVQMLAVIAWCVGLLAPSARGALFTLPKPPVLTSRVGLAWEPSPDTNVTGYNLYWGTNGTLYFDLVTVDTP